MNTNGTPTDVLKENGDFVTFLHRHARSIKVPATCNKVYLANAWMRNRGIFATLFMIQTEEVFIAPDIDEFYIRAAESYKG